ncbi:hypothetical protein BRC75_06870 [Halobacteriales archaeon QH_7_69_31]|nr:MAG: hypothetical protein BRC75_06870 [Halobacteriales archaeon QH_7_69_31]
MKFKVLPPPADSLETVGEVQSAVPLVPDGEESCCMRLLRRTDVASRDAAREWLSFLRALELVEETAGQYRRLPHEADPDRLRAAFRNRVYLAEDVLNVVSAADGPLGAGEVFARVSDRVPQWERHRHEDAADVWRERVRRLLEWAVTLGLLERTEEGYVAA